MNRDWSVYVGRDFDWTTRRKNLPLALVKKHPTLGGRCTYGRDSKEVTAVFIKVLKFIKCAGLLANVM